jgi:glycosyl transferase family 25
MGYAVGITNDYDNENLSKGDAYPCTRKCPFEQRVITIRQQRLDAFFKNNPHLQNVVVHEGIRGDQLDREQMVADGLITPKAAASERVTPGMIGNAHSLRRLFRDCLATQKPMLIMEDDVKTHHDLYGFLEVHEDRLSAMDFVTLGYNTDAPAAWQTDGGLTYTILNQPRFPTYDWIERYFRKTALESVQIHRLLIMFGTCCFLVTPSGAEKILALGFPLTQEATRVPFLKHAMPGVTVDRRLNAVYQKISAGICIPPIALSPNDKAASDTERSGVP